MTNTTMPVLVRAAVHVCISSRAAVGQTYVGDVTVSGPLTSIWPQPDEERVIHARAHQLARDESLRTGLAIISYQQLTDTRVAGPRHVVAVYRDGQSLPLGLEHFPSV